MIIAVDTRLLLYGKLDGIGWFTSENFERITRRHPGHTFHFIFDRPYHPSFVFGKNVIPHVLPPQARHPLLFRVWYDFSLPRLLRSIRPDLLVCPGPVASLKTQVPQLVVLHDLNFEHFPGDLRPAHARYYRKFSRRWAQEATRIATVSEFSKADIISTYGIPAEKIDVVYNGAAERFRPLTAAESGQVRAAYTSGQPYFLFLSSILPRKNLHRLIRAFGQFRQQSGLPYKLVVAGNPYHPTDAVTKALAEVPCREDVVFTGHLRSEELPRVIGAARGLAYVSYFEGFGIPIVEAFRAGVPVVTSNVTAMPEIAADAALLVDPMSVNDITGALQRLAADDFLCQRLIEKGHERAGMYTWERTADLLWKSMMCAAGKDVITEAL
jgi:glycosyltransferase involved in cell wall biosynthesis